MKAYHGTGVQFDAFLRDKILSGEGVAKRGWGFNFSLDPRVAKHFARCAAGRTGYVATVRIPDDDALLDLDAPLESCVQRGSFETLIEDLISRVGGPRFSDVLEAASEDESVSMFYSDDRAESMLRRVFLDSADQEAWEELREFSPGYDWGSLENQLAAIALGLDKNVDTGEKLLEALHVSLEDWEAVNAFLLDHQVYGTIGHEPISRLPGDAPELETRPRSVVIFRAEDVRLESWHQFAKAGPKYGASSFSP